MNSNKQCWQHTLRLHCRRRGLDQACYIFRMYLFFWLTVLIINFIGWLISAVFQTHKNFDLFGSISFCACASVSLVNSQRAFPQRIQTLLVIVWALRLGIFFCDSSLFSVSFLQPVWLSHTSTWFKYQDTTCSHEHLSGVTSGLKSMTKSRFGSWSHGRFKSCGWCWWCGRQLRWTWLTRWASTTPITSGTVADTQKYKLRCNVCLSVLATHTRSEVTRV